MARASAPAHGRKLRIGETVEVKEQLEALLGRLRARLDVFLGRARSADVIAGVRELLAPPEEAAR